MKRIVFLLAIIAAVSLKMPVRAEEPFTASHQIIDGEETLVIEGNAHHPVRIERGDNDNRYTVNGMRHKDGVHVVYGYAELERTPSVYDGFLIAFDDEGTIVVEEVFDYDHLEEVRDVAVGEDAFFVHLSQSKDDRREALPHRRDFLLSVTDTVEVMQEQESRIHRILLEGDALYFSERHQGWYEHAVHVRDGQLDTGMVHGLEDEGRYRGDVTFHSLCETATFEDEPFERNLTVDYPGHYTVGCDGEVHTFTLHPSIDGVELHETSEAPASVDVSGGRVWLNEDLYVNKTIVDMPGNYTLRVEGANGYENTDRFALESGLEGIEDGGVYSGLKTVFFSGEGFLNDEPITSGHSLEESGVHTLRITGADDYEETVSFEILPGKTPPIKNILRFEIVLGACGLIITGLLVFLFLRKR